MRHVILTCKNHPNLRWSTKECAFSGDGVGYNGSRNIFYLGSLPGHMHQDLSGMSCDGNEPECSCHASDLILAPEDALVQIPKYRYNIRVADRSVGRGPNDHILCKDVWAPSPSEALQDVFKRYNPMVGEDIYVEALPSN